MMTKARTLALIEAVLKMRKEATDEQAAEMIMLYPVWKDNTDYKAGDRVRYNDNLYKIISDHTFHADLTPDVATDLYVKI